jgi:uroporphyrinogen III methyltransferase/synthase
VSPRHRTGSAPGARPARSSREDPQAGPLTGRSVAVTRDEEPGEGLAARLELLGARALSWPAVRVGPPEDPAPLMRALESLATYDWIVFTSPRAVGAVGAAWMAKDRDALPTSTRVASVGPATRAALVQHGWRVDRMPSSYGARDLVRLFRDAGDATGARVLFPASSMARPDLIEGLGEAGATVERVEAYRTEPGLEDPARVLADIDAGRADAVTFASPSAVDGLEGGIGRERLQRLLVGAPVAAIGPTTAERLASLHPARLETATDHTLDGLVLAVIKLLEE